MIIIHDGLSQNVESDQSHGEMTVRSESLFRLSLKNPTPGFATDIKRACMYFYKKHDLYARVSVNTC